MTTASEQQTYADLHRAIEYLASVCDGAASNDAQGFNGADTTLGKSLAGRRLWSTKQAIAAWRMVQKYRGQVLAGTGIDVAELPAPVDYGDGLAYDELNAADAQARTRAASGGALVVHDDGATASPVEYLPAKPYTAREILGPGGVIAGKLPGYEAREPQLDVADAVERALTTRQPATIEAGTGTGKSLAYLVPAILSGKRVIVSTAVKALQDQLVGKDLPFLASVMPRPFTYALLKGRGNYVCVQAYEKASKQRQGKLDENAYAFVDKWPALADWLETTDDGDLDAAPVQLPGELRADITVASDECTGKSCPAYSRCFAERAKGRAKTANVVVVNHALLLRDSQLRDASDGHVTMLGDEVDAVIIDEAHQIEEYAVSAFERVVSDGRATRLRARLRRLTVEHPAADNVVGMADAAQWYNSVENVTDGLHAALTELGTRFSGSRFKLGDESAAFGSVLTDARELVEAMEQRRPAWLGEADGQQWDRLADNLADLAEDLAAVVDTSNLGVVRFAERNGQRIELHVTPIDVSEHLRRALWERERAEKQVDGSIRWLPVPVVAASATITATNGFEFFRSRVGLQRDAVELIVPSPFDYKRNALLYLPEDPEQFDPSKSRGAESVAYLDRLAQRIEQLLLASDGRAFVLFTSRTAMNAVHERLAHRLRWTVLVQGELPNGELVRRFKADTHSVLFGLKSFWEGVDVQGESLSMVIIDKLPFTPIDDPVWDARKAAINAKRGDKWAWFNELEIPNCTIQLKQGVGRLIRSVSDRGVVALLDGRMVTKPYGSRILRALPPATTTYSLDAVRAFFGR